MPDGRGKAGPRSNPNEKKEENLEVLGLIACLLAASRQNSDSNSNTVEPRINRFPVKIHFLTAIILQGFEYYSFSMDLLTFGVA